MKHNKEELNKKIEDVARAFGRPATGLLSLRALVSEITGEELTAIKKETTYRVGQRFRYVSETWSGDYMLTYINEYEVAAVNLATGTARRVDKAPWQGKAVRSVHVEKTYAITEQELCKIFRVHPMWLSRITEIK